MADFEKIWGPLRLFKFVTFRAGGAAFTAFMLALLLGPLTVKLLKRAGAVAPSRLAGLVADELVDKDKDNIPCMGGVLIIFSVAVSALLWGRLDSFLIQVFLTTLLALGGLGFLDDYVKVHHSDSGGISAKTKLIMQSAVALCAVFFIFSSPEAGIYMHQVWLPFIKDPVITGTAGAVCAIALGSLAVVGTSNAVNLTDGKDGLAVGCSIFAALAYAAFAYFSGHRVFASYLDVPFIVGAGEVGVFAAALAGACIGFLWHNCYPASMFMGDTGSLALGGTIGLIAVLVRQELTLILVGGVFFVEAVSVILQVAYFKATGGKRIFLCAPIHHHFIAKGWTETQVVVRFWIIAGVCALAAIATLKIR